MEENQVNKRYQQIFSGDWSLEQQESEGLITDSDNIQISEEFQKNSGEASIVIISYQNTSYIEISLIEGHYINNMIKIYLADVDSLIQFFSANDTKEQNATLVLQQALGILHVIKLPGLTGKSCFPEGTHLHITGSSEISEEKKIKEVQIWHLSALITLLTLVAIYNGLLELRLVAKSLEEREMEGQRENYAKKLSIISYSLLCMWNMSYSLSFFVGAMYFQTLFSYFAIPAFWLFLLAFVFQSRIIVMLRALNIYDHGYTREQMKQQLLKCICIHNDIILLNGALVNFSDNAFIWIYLASLDNKECQKLQGCPSNLLKIKPNYGFVIMYITLIAIQLVVLVLQRSRGARFMIPRKYRPNTYDYIKRFRDVDDLESASLSESSYLNDECVVCMHNLRFEVDESMQLIDGQSVRASTYMQTPCNHKFHAKCLQSWMKIKLECPVCRKVLPPNVDD
ncbi:ring-finger-containing ubiquitin ligase [Stylonychia lemnae]|uniref:RING-type E3 ubiquitin transferase n=1 Tax=Stylonychia lemnae TaxID=5949 RepID=A0A078B473_STYLE|nr:ring-finger-containing ubiquitin ligase [Stylonychia lemnae]|eukprot:CDW89330.1 ring-finger-containing ubiquitin ligase [Stylonychia lemnae]